MKQTLHKIGDLAEALNLSSDTLRYYEKQGLLSAAKRSSNGYRFYSEAEVGRLEFILSAKKVGFTLNEIKQLLALEVTKDEKSCADVKSFVDEKLDDVNIRLLELERIKTSLQSLSAACCGGLEPATHCTILEALASNETSLQERSLT